MKHSEIDTEIETSNQNAASARAALDDLPQPSHVDTAAAWTRLQARMRETPASRAAFWTPMRTWSFAGVGALAAAILLVATVAPLRAWAENLLAIFRVERVAVLDINSASIKGLENDPNFNQVMSRMISEQVTVTEPPQRPQSVPDAAAASKLAGFTAHLLAGQTPSGLMVRNTITAQMKLDRDRLQSIVDEAGHSDLRIPASVDGAIIGIRVPAGIMASYGNCGDWTARVSGAKPADAASDSEDASCVKLNELPSPTASAPQELDPAELAQVALQAAGLSATEAANFTQTVDWTSTFVLPILHGQTTYKQVNVNGNQAVLLRPRISASRFHLIWVDNGILYSLMGTGDDTTAMNLASQLE